MPLTSGDRLLLAELTCRNHHDKTGQAVGFGAESVLQPGTHGRSARDHAARVHKGMSRVMVNRIRVQRTDDAHVVGAL